MGAKDFASRLFSLRFPHENDSQFAIRIGQQLTTVRSWRGGSMPRLSTIEEIARRLGVTREWLGFGTKPKRPGALKETIVENQEVAANG